MKVTIALAAAILGAAFATPLAAQHEERWVLLEDVTYHGGDFQPIRIFLARGLRYRAQFSEPNVVLQMRSYEGKPIPFIRLVDNAHTGADAAGRYQVELAPNADGIIELSAVDGTPGTATHFQLWQIGPPPAKGADSLTVARTSLPMEFGFVVTAGKHGAYDLRDTSFIKSGAVIEGCLAIRGGPGAFDRLSGCLFGYSHSTGFPSGSLDLVFFEPHIRLIGPQLHVGRTISGGVIARVTEYVGRQHEDSTSGGSVGTVPNFGAGVYGALESRGVHRGGTAIEVALLFDQIGGSGGRKKVIFTSTSPKSSANAFIFRVGGGWFF